MTKTITELTAFWNRCDLKSHPFAHPDDLPILSRGANSFIDVAPIKAFEEFVAGERFGAFDDHRFHLSLLPIPYGGDIANADIIILLLNPGFGYTDYYAEMRVPAYRQRLEMNLRQSFKGTEFPFMWLDPELCWHGGFFWWEKKLRDVITIIANERFNGKYLDALRDLSTRLAQIELVPYHSQSFHGHGLLKTLPSVLAAKRYVRETLIPQASKGEKTIIVTRQEAGWDLPNNTKNLVIYRGGQTRGASLSPTSLGGKAILKRYDIVHLRDVNAAHAARRS